MPWGFYGRGRGYWGQGRGRGNPYPFCRFYPWLPRGWWRFGYSQYGTYGHYGAYPWGRPPAPYVQPPVRPYPPPNW
ncbi:MAG: hypothetical protein ACP5G2_07715 [Candidatus Bipolaricaulaceae bacterium]